MRLLPTTLLPALLVVVALPLQAALLDPESPPNSFLDGLVAALDADGIDIARNLNTVAVQPGDTPLQPRLGLLADVPARTMADTQQLQLWEEAYDVHLFAAMAVLRATDTPRGDALFLSDWFATTAGERAFITHAASDAPYAEKMALRLQESGYEVRLFPPVGSDPELLTAGQFYATSGLRLTLDSATARKLNTPAQEIALLGRELIDGSDSTFPEKGTSSRYYAAREPRRFRKADLGDEQQRAEIPEIIVSGGVAFGERARFTQAVQALVFTTDQIFELVLSSGEVWQLPQADPLLLKACFDFALRSERTGSDAIIDIDEDHRIKISSAFRDTDIGHQLIDIDEQPFRYVKRLDAIKSVLIDRQVEILAAEPGAHFVTDYEVRFINPDRRKLAETRAALGFQFDSQTNSSVHTQNWGPDAYRINAVDYASLGEKIQPAALVASWSALFRAIETGTAEFTRGRYEFLKIDKTGTTTPELSRSRKKAMHLCLDEVSAQTIKGCTWLIESGDDISLVLRANAYLRRAVAEDLGGEFDAAIDDYSQAIRLAPEEARLYQFRGAVWGQKGNYKKAIRDHNRALKLDPNRSEAWFYRGFSYSRLDKYEKAIEDYSRALELDPGFSRALNNRAHSYIALGDYDKALPDLNTAIQLKPQYALAYANRADCHYELGDYTAAMNDHRTSIELDPDNADLYNSSCWTQAITGDGQAAMPDCNEAIRLQPEVPQFYDSRALAWYQLGEYGKALADAERAMAEPDWEVYILRAAILENLGRQKAATADYKKARRLQRDRNELEKRISVLGMTQQVLSR
jgi:tetratricopeptide (TPR) repeat protein